MPFKENPFDSVLQSVKDAMVEVDDQMRDMAKDVRPFDSKELTTGEDDLLFHNPNLRYPGEIDPKTGLPLTNAQATQRWANEDPQGYVSYVDDYVRRHDRRNADVNDQLNQMDQGAMQ